MVCGNTKQRIQRMEEALEAQQEQLQALKTSVSSCVDVRDLGPMLDKKADLELVEALRQRMDEQHGRISEELAKKVSTSQLAEEMNTYDARHDRLTTRVQQQEQIAAALAASTAAMLDRHTEELQEVRGRLDSLSQRQERHEGALAEAAEAGDQQRQGLEEASERAAAIERQVVTLELLLNDAQGSIASCREEQQQGLREEEAQRRAKCDMLQGDIATVEKQVMELLAEAARSREVQEATDGRCTKLAEDLQGQVQRHDDLSNIVALKVDTSWAEQQRSLIEATQVSLMAVNRRQRELDVMLAEKTGSEVSQGLSVQVAGGQEQLGKLWTELHRHREQLQMVSEKQLDHEQLHSRQLLELQRHLANIRSAQSSPKERQHISHRKAGILTVASTPAPPAPPSRRHARSVL